MILRQDLAPFHRPIRNPGILGDHGFGSARNGVFSNRRSLCPDAAMASIFFSLIRRVTSCPREDSTSPTAIPGNKCPPVPPHAISTWTEFLVLDFTEVQSWG